MTAVPWHAVSMLGRRRSNAKQPSIWIGARDLEVMIGFFAGIGWSAEVIEPGVAAVVSTPGGTFGLRVGDPSLLPRLELALNVPDPLLVDEAADLVEEAGGLMMEPVQETAWGGWGCSFNDPEGNNWELGFPETVTATDYSFTGRRAPTDGPLVALVVPPSAAPPRSHLIQATISTNQHI